MSDSTRRVVAAYLKLADQPSGARQKARTNTQPINKAKGISPTITKSNGQMQVGEDGAAPDRRDITPKDVFSPSPKSMGVLNFAQTGEDLQHAIGKQVPKDKGFDVVRNLSQYLIRTEGNGGSGTSEGK